MMQTSAGTKQCELSLIPKNNQNCHVNLGQFVETRTNLFIIEAFDSEGKTHGAIHILSRDQE